MLYGGPLGTYLSGLSSANATSSPSLSNSSGYTSSHSSTATNPHVSGSSYIGSNGLRRTNSRYSGSTALNGSSYLSTPSSSYTSSGSGSNSYHTPQLRRKYGGPEPESSSFKRSSGSTGRYISQPKSRTSPTSGSATLSASSSSHGAGPLMTNSGAGPMNTYHYPRWPQTNKPIGSSLSWNSDLSTASDETVNYRQLYENQKLVTDDLQKRIQSAEKLKRELLAQIDEANGVNKIPSNVENRKLERRLSECEQEMREYEKLKAESDKLRAEHRALVRVVSRLNREQ